MNKLLICPILLWGLLPGSGTLFGEEAAAAALVAGSAKNTPPAEFLDALGKTAKARWRLYFRPPPPTPPVDRSKAALILGSLIAESHLIWQAGDSQQFRNNNQDLITYCRMIGVAEHIVPRLMTQGKMAEQEQWKELRQEITLTHSELCGALREMQDEDLSRLIDAGLWLRVLEVSASVELDAPAELAAEVHPSTLSAAHELRRSLAAVSAPLRGASRRLAELESLASALDGKLKPASGEEIQKQMQSLLDKER